MELIAPDVEVGPPVSTFWEPQGEALVSSWNTVTVLVLPTGYIESVVTKMYR